MCPPDSDHPASSRVSNFPPADIVESQADSRPPRGCRILELLFEKTFPLLATSKRGLSRTYAHQGDREDSPEETLQSAEHTDHKQDIRRTRRPTTPGAGESRARHSQGGPAGVASGSHGLRPRISKTPEHLNHSAAIDLPHRVHHDPPSPGAKRSTRKHLSPRPNSPWSSESTRRGGADRRLDGLVGVARRFRDNRLSQAELSPREAPPIPQKRPAG